MKAAVTAALLSIFTAHAVILPQVPLSSTNNNNGWSTELDSNTIDAWSKMDVVEVMKMVGMDDGLDERRIVQIFGQDGYRMYVVIAYNSRNSLTRFTV